MNSKMVRLIIAWAVVVSVCLVVVAAIVGWLISLIGWCINRPLESLLGLVGVAAIVGLIFLVAWALNETGIRK